MAEIFVIGEIQGAENFQSKTLFCRYTFNEGPNWVLISGSPEGQTSADSALYEGPAVWSHPIDLHYMCKGIQGWPSISVEVHCIDGFGRSWCLGYGTAPVPRTPGSHTFSIPCWAPKPTSIFDRLRQYMIGGSTELTKPEAVFEAADRYKLKTVSTGEVFFNLQLILRNFTKFGIEYK